MVFIEPISQFGCIAITISWYLLMRRILLYHDQVASVSLFNSNLSNLVDRYLPRTFSRSPGQAALIDFELPFSLEDKPYRPSKRVYQSRCEQEW